jgi:DnaK suppressor protein
MARTGAFARHKVAPWTILVELQSTVTWFRVCGPGLRAGEAGMETAAEEYRPSDDEPYMNPRQLEYFRHKLETWRQNLIAESEETLEHLRSENWQEPDPNDRASHESEASLELRTRDRYRKLIGKIDAALRRIELGSTGTARRPGSRSVSRGWRPGPSPRSASRHRKPMKARNGAAGMGDRASGSLPACHFCRNCLSPR